jgi:hypothetical protein
MFPRKVNLYALLLIALTACTKQEIVPSSALSSLQPDTSYAAGVQLPQLTTFGLIEENTTEDQTKADMKKANVNIIRLTIFLSQTTVNKNIDNYLSQGYNVQISVSWFTGTNTNRGFPSPKDTSAVRSQANAFFKHYSNRKNQISFVSVENEWDHEVQAGSGKLQDYINELSIITSVGHKYGFKISDGGITYASLQRWTYSQLTGNAQEQWRRCYYVGLNDNYDAFLNMINTYIAGAKKIGFDYSNVHWYNAMMCSNGYGTASSTFMNACNKKTSVCNEFGIKTSSLTLFTETVDEITGNSKYAVAYSGTNQENKAIKLTNSMLLVLATAL